MFWVPILPLSIILVAITDLFAIIMIANKETVIFVVVTPRIPVSIGVKAHAT